MQYFKILDNGGTPQQARGVLPSSTKADIVMTATLREWEHIFNLRACDSTGPAHPQIKEVMVPLLQDMQVQYQFAYGTMIPAELK
jgi:thymidylate synthase (FAD)